MHNKKIRIQSEEVAKAAIDALERRNVTIQDIAEIVFEMQKSYNDGLQMEHCIQSVERVLRKREVQHAILVGIELDELAEKKMLSEPLQSIVASDEGLFGVDELIALGAVFTYGSIAVTTFGHLDKQKVGVIERLDTKPDFVNTFLDDLVCSIAASAASRIAHRMRDLEEEGGTFADIPPATLGPQKKSKEEI